MKNKTLVKKLKKSEETYSEEEIQKLQIENLALRDLVNLKDESYFRQQLLSLVERIAKALEQEESNEELKKENED